MAIETGLDRFISRSEPSVAAPAETTSSAAETGKEASAVPAPAAEKTESEPAKQETASAAEPDDFDPNDPAEKTPHQRKGLRTALGAEKKKRQEAERQLEELRQRSQAPQAAAAPQEQAQTDPNSAFYGDPAKHIDTVAEAKAKAAAAGVQKQLFQMSRRQMMQQHQDFTQAEEAFLEAARSDGGALFARLNAAVASGSMLETEFAYETGKQLLELEQLGVNSLPELKAALEKRVREEFEAQQRKNGALAAAEKASTSSAGARGSGQTSPIVADDSEEPIGKILKRR